MGVRDGLQSFTAIGQVRAGDVYKYDMGGGLVPARRDVDWFTARDVPIHPLRDDLALTRGKTNWSAPFRFGLVPISADDFAQIEAAMTGVHESMRWQQAGSVAANALFFNKIFRTWA